MKTKTESRGQLPALLEVFFKFFCQAMYRPNRKKEGSQGTPNEMTGRKREGEKPEKRRKNNTKVLGRSTNQSPAAVPSGQHKKKEQRGGVCADRQHHHHHHPCDGEKEGKEERLKQRKEHAAKRAVENSENMTREKDKNQGKKIKATMKRMLKRDRLTVYLTE